jgi:hypothetical protein
MARFVWSSASGEPEHVDEERIEIVINAGEVTFQMKGIKRRLLTRLVPRAALVAIMIVDLQKTGEYEHRRLRVAVVGKVRRVTVKSRITLSDQDPQIEDISTSSYASTTDGC